MTTIGMFLTGVALTMVLSLLIILYLRRSLGRVLNDLCGSKERAAFWLAFTNVVLVLMPIFIALCYTPSDKPGTNPFFEITAQFKWGILGLLFATIVMGSILLGFTPKEPLPAKNSFEFETEDSTGKNTAQN